MYLKLSTHSQAALTLGRFPSRPAVSSGSALVMVLWMVVILGVIGLAYTNSVRTQMQVGSLEFGRTQAWWAARAGIEKARVKLANLKPGPLGESDKLFNDPASFKDQKVGRARFSLIVPPADAQARPRYGLLDEASRVNINVVDEASLLRFKSMTDEMAQSLLDWRENGLVPRPKGAKDEYYLSRPEPYHVKSGPFTSLRELSLVRGWERVTNMVWPDLYKKFASRKARGEEIRSFQEMTPRDARNILMNLTIWSMDIDLAPDGQDKMDLATAPLGEIRKRLPDLSDLEAQSIVQKRVTGGFGSPLDLLIIPPPPPATASPIFDLRRAGGLMDYFTLGQAGQRRPGMININTASREVLLTLPGFEENLVSQILNARKAKPFHGPGELAAMNGMNEDLFRRVYPLITVRCGRFHVFSQGVEPLSRACVTIEAALAVRGRRARIIYWKELAQP